MVSIDELRELAATYAKQALLYEKRGKIKEAIINYNKSVSLLKKLIEMDDNDEVRKIYEDRLKQYAKRMLKLLKKDTRVLSSKKTISKSRGAERDDLSKIIKEAIVTEKPDIKWDDIADLEDVKRTLMEAIVWPMLRPDLFEGSRQPWKGILLFGPPGCGKTLLAKAVAGNINATFFNVDSSIILSKWFGESAKIVRELFKMARKNQPAIIFIDEVDALASTREGSENDAMRRVKTTLLSQMDGLYSKKGERLVVIAATNLPEDIDPAFRRRFEKRIYVPPPNKEARKEIFKIHLKGIEVSNDVDFDKLAELTEGYTGSDIALIVREASMRPIRELAEAGKLADKNSKPRKVNMEDFLYALKIIRPSLNVREIKKYEEWAERFASG
ncbi:MAG: AAA family ATPase [Candidatus Njordarchaeia archaeon]